MGNMLPRVHLWEWHDLSWFPNQARAHVMEVLAIGWMTPPLYLIDVALQQLRTVMETTGRTHVVDLCSGGGGPMIHAAKTDIKVTLTDLYPQTELWEKHALRSDGNITYKAESVSALAMPQGITGLRTLWCAFHHFRPEQATQILASAVQCGEPILIYELTRRSLVQTLFIVLGTLNVSLVFPLLGWLSMDWKSVLITYVLPLYPFIVVFDGMVSCMRTYTKAEMVAMVEKADPDGSFTWKVQEVQVRWWLPGMNMISLIGLPKSTSGIQSKA
ncbi:hypothetical protein SARC_03602 [Sphaeroforma arctica JP610]|uniref:Methyltransferase domain-containing protein n=1 Tax=Sphaeroforma arctica JP610 TaxID=667725 RepID=A0A0L0G575_9EUKA|nr:hypothetical protein SARC_03602 [Sphaeroforma arctica JP610]KNC84180.1 hypothetical protein SARC_03602 [Sphaeroforma arctica JP610]|eukprot:XP_014158082.1 hypothetical protein SARC_03602 [Sphaeroforma arctica JP610]